MTLGSGISRHVSHLRGQLLGALAVGWALGGCGGRTEGLGQLEPEPPPEGCPHGNAEVQCYPVLTLDAIARGIEEYGMYPAATYTDEGCVDAHTATLASNSYYCGPYPAGTPTRREEACCYAHCNQTPTCGRPFVVGGEARVARARACLEWAHPGPQRDGAPAVSVSSSIAREWLHDALAEHASIASFSAFTLSLLALGAPAALVRGSTIAAQDEVFHATTCFALAAAYGDESLGPAPLPMTDLRVETDLASAAARAFMDGCFGETAAALIARASLDVCGAPDVRVALARIALDEASHAELAWQFVAWALRQGGDAVASALSSSLEQALATVSGTSCRASERACAEWHHAGRLSEGERASITERALRDIVRPALAALLSRHQHLAPAERAALAS